MCLDGETTELYNCLAEFQDFITKLSTAATLLVFHLLKLLLLRDLHRPQRLQKKEEQIKMRYFIIFRCQKIDFTILHT